jgi:DNA mismatch repair protein MutS2
MEKIDIHGLIASEAEIKINLFIKESYIHRRYFILIIHGTGRHVLLRLVHKLARDSIYVDRYEFAPPNMGGTGATILYMNKRGMNL